MGEDLSERARVGRRPQGDGAGGVGHVQDGVGVVERGVARGSKLEVAAAKVELGHCGARGRVRVDELPVRGLRGGGGGEQHVVRQEAEEARLAVVAQDVQLGAGGVVDVGVVALREGEVVVRVEEGGGADGFVEEELGAQAGFPPRGDGDVALGAGEQQGVAGARVRGGVVRGEARRGQVEGEGGLGGGGGVDARQERGLAELVGALERGLRLQMARGVGVEQRGRRGVLRGAAHAGGGGVGQGGALAGGRLDGLEIGRLVGGGGFGCHGAEGLETMRDGDGSGGVGVGQTQRDGDGSGSATAGQTPSPSELASLGHHWAVTGRGTTRIRLDVEQQCKLSTLSVYDVDTWTELDLFTRVHVHTCARSHVYIYKYYRRG